MDEGRKMPSENAGCFFEEDQNTFIAHVLGDTTNTKKGLIWF